MALNSLLSFLERARDVSRRDLFRGGLLAASSTVLPRVSALPASSKEPKFGPDIYESLGVRPLVNAQHLTTQIGGSLAVPEALKAMDFASRHFVQIDELMEAVGTRLAELTGSEYCIVTSGCAAAMSHATAACIAGADPEKILRLPDLTGLKSEVVAPRWSRNRYDHAIRLVGVKIINVDSLEQLEAAIGPKTAMVFVLGHPNDKGPFGLEPVSEIARRKGIPVLVDAAAEELFVPNIHLQRGATLVAYSGGKVIRGPQCAGLLMGRKDLVRAAWLHSAPHHALGRPMKVGKEEIIGMLAAVEVFMKKDRKAEWKQWEAWLDHIARRVKAIDGVTTEVARPTSLTGNCPVLVIKWDGAKLGITGTEVRDLMFEGKLTPRIALAGATGERRDSTASSVTVRPLTMMPGEEKVVADAIHSLLSRPPGMETPARRPPEVNIAGQWRLHIDYVCGSVEHVLFFEQQGNELTGIHKGEILSGELGGTVEGAQVDFRSAQKHEGSVLRYGFAGKVDGNSMQGTVDLGEYGEGRWTAQRATYPDPRSFVRPARNS